MNLKFDRFNLNLIQKIISSFVSIHQISSLFDFKFHGFCEPLRFRIFLQSRLTKGYTLCQQIRRVCWLAANLPWAASLAWTNSYCSAQFFNILIVFLGIKSFSCSISVEKVSSIFSSLKM